METEKNVFCLKKIFGTKDRQFAKRYMSARAIDIIN